MTKTVLGIMLTLLLINMMNMAFNIKQVGSTEPPMTEWDRTYGTTAEEQARYMIRTSDGGYALVGYNVEWMQMREGGRDFWLVKTDADGIMEWNKTYVGYVAAYQEPVVQTNDGGYAITGHNLSRGGGYDLWLIKTDAIGNIEWNRSYGEGDDYYAGSLVQTKDGGYAIAGKKGWFYAGEQDVWLVKTDSAGNMEWNRTYGGASNDIGYSLIQTPDGGYAVAGATNIYGTGDYDGWFFKTDSAGNMEWNRTYKGIEGGYVSGNVISLILTGDGGYALAGYKHSPGPGETDFWLIKTNSTGHMQWNRTYGGENYDHAYSVVQTRDGGYALAGNTQSFGAGSYDFWLVKTDAGGNVQWNQTYGGTSWETAISVVQTDDGGYAIAGYTNSFGAGSYDFWLIKLAPTTINAIIDIDPDTLNLKSNGEWITAYITLLEGYNVEDIVLETVYLDGIPASRSEIQNGVYMVKFDRATVQTSLTNEPDYDSAPKFYDLTLKATGELVDGTPFEGTDTITVIKK